MRPEKPREESALGFSKGRVGRMSFNASVYSVERPARREMLFIGVHEER
jgi:hypothetical protein